MEILKREELIDVIYGSGFFGGGGGGSLEEGLTLLETLKEDEQQLKLIPIDEMEDDPNIVSTMAAALGSPVATKGKTFSDEAVNAVLGMMDEAISQNKELKYVYSGEQGGGNTMLPLYAAIKLNLPVLDLDANGRAVPELNTGLLPIHDIPTSPVILASGKGDVIVGRTKDPLDSKGCETIARQMCMAYDMGIGFAAWMMNKNDHLNASAIGQITLTRKVGHVLRKSNPETLFSELENVLEPGNIRAFVNCGVITKLDLNTESGFDDGITTVTSETGEKFTMVFKNENLILFDQEGNAVSTVPDIISVIDMGDGVPMRPLSNSEIKVGQKVMVTVTRANKRWDDANGYECWSDILKEAGYSVAGPRVKL